ncbi:hypothetical protein GQ55_5G348000 [Panicum hallii var. hallii]|uniref:Uncharacterized protein n=1 Tax=Panicum hallii var. hallii TaxID=1504633 RepID=A0A2T7DM82_9POAL|nr:hypothetical protein GQ55_5G348000 [Panicum hallii var. hallii]
MAARERPRVGGALGRRAAGAEWPRGERDEVHGGCGAAWLRALPSEMAGQGLERASGDGVVWRWEAGVGRSCGCRGRGPRANVQGRRQGKLVRGGIGEGGVGPRDREKFFFDSGAESCGLTGKLGGVYMDEF